MFIMRSTKKHTQNLKKLLNLIGNPIVHTGGKGIYFLNKKNLTLHFVCSLMQLNSIAITQFCILSKAWLPLLRTTLKKHSSVSKKVKRSTPKTE